MIDAIDIIDSKYADVNITERHNIGEKLYFHDFNDGGETIVVEVQREGGAPCGRCFFNMLGKVCPAWGCDGVIFVEIC